MTDELLKRLREPFDREAVQEEVRRAAIENRVPFSEPVAGRRDVVPEGVFTGADLTRELLPEGVRYEVSEGKHLFVHAVTSEDQESILEWCLGHSDEEEPVDRGMSAHLMAKRAMLYQVIRVCKQGPEYDSPRVFARSDAASIRRFLPYTHLTAICQISEELSGQGEQIGAGVRGFFGLIRSCCEISSSVSATSTSCPPGFAEVLRDCGSLASRARSRGKWDAGMSHDALAMVQQLAEVSSGSR